MQHLNYVLCDLGIISRCSAVLQWSCHANNEISTICSSSKATWSFMIAWVVTQPGQCHRVVLWPTEIYLHRSCFVVVCPSSRAKKTSFPRSQKTSTCFLFKSTYFLPLPMNNSPLIYCGADSTVNKVSMPWLFTRVCLVDFDHACSAI